MMGYGMRGDTKVRSYNNSLTLTLSQRERGFMVWVPPVSSAYAQGEAHDAPWALKSSTANRKTVTAG